MRDSHSIIFEYKWAARLPGRWGARFPERCLRSWVPPHIKQAANLCGTCSRCRYSSGSICYHIWMPNVGSLGKLSLVGYYAVSTYASHMQVTFEPQSPPSGWPHDTSLPTEQRHHTMPIDHAHVHRRVRHNISGARKVPPRPLCVETEQYPPNRKRSIAHFCLRSWCMPKYAEHPWPSSLRLPSCSRISRRSPCVFRSKGIPGD